MSATSPCRFSFHAVTLLYDVIAAAAAFSRFSLSDCHHAAYGTMCGRVSLSLLMRRRASRHATLIIATLDI